MATNIDTIKYFNEQAEWIVNEFERCNMIVFGPKGTGKDLLFAYVMWLRNVFYYANMPYDRNTIVLKSLKCLGVGNNTYEDIVNGTIKKYDDPFLQGADIYISDGGVYFGCQNDSAINTAYPGIAIFEALSRQLGQHNTHINLQALSRLYIKFREQADGFIKCLSTANYGKYFLVNTISYEYLNSASSGILPFASDNKKSRAYEEFVGHYGQVEYRTFYIPKEAINYDTHYFAQLFLNNRPTKQATKSNNFWRF